ncbi:EF-hand domain-containing protein [Planctellipticum variicoloris]|uniref:EF-hand domain-containing protein n=1 Tax=Planctellipticum variicoloris TaxID=3064265 RepID=UPI0030132CB5|nr:EF-hand domain-containing protein [Planctomycetaceae bacterium SH412]
MQREHWLWGAALAAAIGPAGLAAAQDALPKPADLFKQLDKNADGKLVADEIPQEHRRLFERVQRAGDKNEDGQLTVEEFEAAHQPDAPSGGSLGGPGGPGGGRPNPEEIRERLKQMDRNGDGKISRSEVPDVARERLMPLFDRLGKDELSLEDLGRFSGGQRPEPGQLFGQLDKNGDGKVSRDELPADARERMARIFDQAGKDELTREEFAAAFRGAMQGPPVEGNRPRTADGQPGGRPGMGPFRAPRFLQKLDADGDGRLSKSEFAKAPDLFADLDENGDGQLEPRELMGPPPEGMGPGTALGGRRPAAGRPEMEGRRPEGDRPGTPQAGRPDGQFFARLDKDGDGKLSKDEAPERMQKNFDQLDRNSDGFVDREELASSFRQGRPGGRPPAEGQPEKKPE